MIKFAYIYALPGYSKPEISHVKTKTAEFVSVAIDYADLPQAVVVAEKLVKEEGVNMIELCGGLANADIVSRVKQAVGPNIPVGQVMYGPEFRRTLADLVSPKKS